MRIFVTGTAGFIGFHVARRLLAEGHEVVGFDGFTPYYDVSLKERRSEVLRQHNGFREHRAMLEEREALERAFTAETIDAVIHLAAQAGVRYSLENPQAYIDANLVGTFNVMELTRRFPVQHLMLASTSSVYGANTVMPFREIDQADHPLTLYAATKKATEAMTHSYAHLWSIPTTAFRFFSVYGPWGRPDMALFKFTRGILEGTPIDIYNNGRMGRDFTYVEDLAEAVVRLMECPPPVAAGRAPPDPIDTLSPAAPWRVVNIGAEHLVTLLDFVGEIEKAVGREAVRNYMPMQPGDVPDTLASSALLARLTGFRPSTPIERGVPAFVAWYRDFYGV